MKILVLKDNILVIPLELKKKGNIELDNRTMKRSVAQRYNGGVVIAVSDSVTDVRLGDVVGYSSYDGVELKVEGKDCIILSHREVQSVIKKDFEHVRFGIHNRDEGTDILMARKIEGHTGSML